MLQHIKNTEDIISQIDRALNYYAQFEQTEESIELRKYLHRMRYYHVKGWDTKHLRIKKYEKLLSKFFERDYEAYKAKLRKEKDEQEVLLDAIHEAGLFNKYEEMRGLGYE